MNSGPYSLAPPLWLIGLALAIFTGFSYLTYKIVEDCRRGLKGRVDGRQLDLVSCFVAGGLWTVGYMILALAGVLV